MTNCKGRIYFLRTLNCPRLFLLSMLLSATSALHTFCIRSNHTPIYFFLLAHSTPPSHRQVVSIPATRPSTWSEQGAKRNGNERVEVYLELPNIYFFRRSLLRFIKAANLTPIRTIHIVPESTPHLTCVIPPIHGAIKRNGGQRSIKTVVLEAFLDASQIPE